MPKKVLFITHDASRTGAPIVFLNFLRWFKQNSDIPFQILLRKGGVLEPEFAALSKVDVINKGGRISRVAQRLGWYGNTDLKLKRKLLASNIGLVYSNTVANADVIHQFSGLNCPIITHVHELETSIQKFAGLNFKNVKRFTNHYIACSKAVKNNLVESHALAEDSISVIYETIPATSNFSHDVAASNYAVRKSLGIPKEAIVVGGSGTTDWRKGPDLFIQLARAVHRQTLSVPIYFIWLGGAAPGTLEHAQLTYDLTKLGLHPYVRFLGSKANPLDFFSAFDIFALTSREDPYPLVFLEAASLGKPILCFANSGGECEFVETDCGFVVPYLDVQAMADRVIDLAMSPGLREQMGHKASQKVKERHDVSVACPQIVDVIRRMMHN